MEKQIIDIEFGDGIVCIGQIRKDFGHDLQVAILEHVGDGLWDFDEELECVPRESVSGFYDTTDLEKTGLYEEVDASDTEYVLPSDIDNDDSGSEVSLEDEF